MMLRPALVSFGPPPPPARIPLANAPGLECWMDQEDWEEWQLARMPMELMLHGHRVACFHRPSPTGMLDVARWVRPPGDDQRLLFRTKNLFDLRKQNLRVVKRTPWRFRRAEKAAAKAALTSRYNCY